MAGNRQNQMRTKRHLRYDNNDEVFYLKSTAANFSEAKYKKQNVWRAYSKLLIESLTIIFVVVGVFPTTMSVVGKSCTIKQR